MVEPVAIVAAVASAIAVILASIRKNHIKKIKACWGLCEVDGGKSTPHSPSASTQPGRDGSLDLNERVKNAIKKRESSLDLERKIQEVIRRSSETEQARV